MSKKRIPARALLRAVIVTHHLDRAAADWITHAHKGKVKTKDSNHHVEQRRDNLRGIAAIPNRRKSQDTDQIVYTTPQTPGLVGCLFQLRFSPHRF